MQKSGFMTRETWISVKKHRFIFILEPRSAATAHQCFSRKCVFRNNCQEIIIMKFISILTVFPMLSTLTMMRSGASHLHVVFCVLLPAALEIAPKFKCQTMLLECFIKPTFPRHQLLKVLPALPRQKVFISIYFIYHTNSDIESERASESLVITNFNFIGVKKGKRLTGRRNLLKSMLTLICSPEPYT